MFLSATRSSAAPAVDFSWPVCRAGPPRVPHRGHLAARRHGAEGWAGDPWLPDLFEPASEGLATLRESTLVVERGDLDRQVGFPERPFEDLLRSAQTDTRVLVIDQSLELVDRPADKPGKPFGGQTTRLLTLLALRLGGLLSASPPFLRS